MRRVRLTVSKGKDLTEELRYLARIRQALYAHSPVEVDPDNPIHGTHRNSDGKAYFEFVTDHIKEVERVLNEHDKAKRVALSYPRFKPGSECVNCGNIAGSVTPAVCPNCGFREISACPYCAANVPRESYIDVAGDLQKCPDCKRRVRFKFADPLFKRDGTYQQPLVDVEKVE